MSILRERLREAGDRRDWDECDRLEQMQQGMTISMPVEIIQVFKPGSWVKIADDLPATIRQVSMDEGGVTYEVVWWDGRTRHCQWLAPHEIRASAPVMVPIGFVGIAE